MITTVVGSYPKIGPGIKAPSLRNAISQFDQGRITRDRVLQVEREVTQEVIQEQVEAGVDLVTDGQIRWDDGQTYFARGIGGFTVNGLTRYFDTNTYFRQPIAQAPLAWGGPISVDDFAFAQAHSPKPVKAVVAGPYTLARLSQRGCYSDFGTLVGDLARALNREALALQDAGATVIQFDEPAIIRYKDDLSYLQATSETLTQGLSAKTVLCTYFGDVSGLAPDLFQLPFQVFGLDFAWGPANLQLLSTFPADKELTMGLLDARNTRLEPVEEIVEAVRRVTHFVSLDRLHLSPSCGLDFLPRANARAKLARLVEGARTVQEVLS